MTPKIIDFKEKRLVGLRIRTSMSENKTFELWKTFKTQLKGAGTTFYSVQVYDAEVGKDFTASTLFDKWAAVGSNQHDSIPEDMEELIIPEGKYAVFIHKGPITSFNITMNHIMNTWLPTSGYKLAARPHFEIMDQKYLGPLNPASEEEVWIPIK